MRSAHANKESEGLAKSIADKTGVDPSVLSVSSKDPVVNRVLRDEALRDFLAALDDALAGESQGLESVDGIGEELAEKLKEAGFHTVDDLKNASEEDLIAVDGVGKSKAAKLKAL